MTVKRAGFVICGTSPNCLTDGNVDSTGLALSGQSSEWDFQQARYFGRGDLPGTAHFGLDGALFRLHQRI